MIRLGLSLATGMALIASAALASDDDGHVTHINVPFVNLDIHHDHGGSRVQVDAPFAHIEKPANSTMPIVRAPFTHVSDPPGGNVNVQAPFTHVYTPADNSPVQVRAPFTHVTSPKGVAPTQVSAPFTHVNQSKVRTEVKAVQQN